MQDNCRSFKGLGVLCFWSASPAEALSHLRWLARPLCDSQPVWLLRSFYKTLFMWLVISSAALLRRHNIYSLELLGQLDHYMYSHMPSQKWVRRVFACPRKLCLECNSNVIVSVASLPLDFVYRRRGVPYNLSKNHQTLFYLSFKGSVSNSCTHLVIYANKH